MTSKNATVGTKNTLKAALAGLAVCAAVSLGTVTVHTAAGASTGSPHAAVTAASEASGEATDPWGRWGSVVLASDGTDGTDPWGRYPSATA